MLNMNIVKCSVCGRTAGLVGPDVYNLCVVTHSNCVKPAFSKAESVRALAFQQIKEAWLLRKFAPGSPMAYLLIHKFGVRNIIEYSKDVTTLDPYDYVST